MLRHILTLAAGAWICGCASLTPTPVPTRAFTTALTSSDSAAYVAYTETGTSTISGQAFLTTRGGDVKVGAGREVILDPATAYADAWIQHLGSSIAAYAAVAPAPMFAVARRSTTADAEGRFRFTNLPPGKYYVRTTVTWEVPSGRSLYMPMDMQGGVVGTMVSVGAGESKEVMLNKMLD